jgi:hypothetical protein
MSKISGGQTLPSAEQYGERCSIPTLRQAMCLILGSLLSFCQVFVRSTIFYIA